MKIGNVEMPDTGNKIKVTVDTEKGKLGMYLTAEVIAKSAFEHNVDLESFKATLDKFSDESKSSIPQIYAWREEATQIYFDLLEKAGKLKHGVAEFLGESDYKDSDNEDDPSISNINKNNKEN